MTVEYIEEVADRMEEEYPDSLEASKIAAMRWADERLVEALRNQLTRGVSEDEAVSYVDDYFETTILPRAVDSVPERDWSIAVKKYAREDPTTGDYIPFFPDMLDENPDVAELGSALSSFVESNPNAVSQRVYDYAHGDIQPDELKRLTKAVKKASWHPFVSKYLGDSLDEDSIANFARTIALEQLNTRGRDKEIIERSSLDPVERIRSVDVYSPLTNEVEARDFVVGPEGGPVEPAYASVMEVLDLPRQVVESTGIPQRIHESGLLGDLLAPDTPIREYAADPTMYFIPGGAEMLASTRAGQAVAKSLSKMAPKLPQLATKAGSQVINPTQKKALLNLYRKAKVSTEYLESPSAIAAMEKAGIGPQSIGADVGLAKQLQVLRDTAEETLKASDLAARSSRLQLVQSAKEAATGTKRETLEAVEAAVKRDIRNNVTAVEALDRARKEVSGILRDYSMKEVNYNLANSVAFAMGSPVKKGGLAKWWNQLKPAEREALLIWDNIDVFDKLVDAQRRHIRGAPFKNQSRPVRQTLEKIWLKIKEGEVPTLKERPPHKKYGVPRKASTILARKGLKETGTELDLDIPLPGVPVGSVTDISADTLKKQLGPTRPMDRPRLADFIEDITGERKALEELTEIEGKALGIRLKEAELGQALSDLPESSVLDDFLRDLYDEGQEIYYGRHFLDSFRDPGRMIASKLGMEGKSLVSQVDRVNNFFQRAVDRVSKEVQDVLGDIQHGSLEDEYIFKSLDGQPQAKELAKTIKPERLIELDYKVTAMRGLFDRVIEQANSSRAVVRKAYGLKESQLPDIGRTDDYVTHLMQDPVLVPIHEGGMVDRLSSEVFNQFFKERTKDLPFTESIIDAANAYFPVSLRSVYWTPVRARWKYSLSKKIPTGGAKGKKIQDMIKYADDWVEYISGHSSSVGRMMDTLIENPITRAALKVPGVSRVGAQLAGLKATRVARVGSSLLAGMVYFNTLGGNVSAAVANSTQALNALLKYPPIDFIPAAAIHMSNSKLVQGVMKALKLEGLDGNFFNPKRWEKLHKQRGTVKGGLFQYLGKPKRKAARGVMSVALSPFQWAEEMVRKTTVMTSVLNGVRKGLPKKEIVKRVHRDLAYMQFDFTPVGQLPFLRSPMGRGMFQYARYPIQQLDFYLSEAVKAGGGVLDGFTSRDVLSLMDPATRWGVYVSTVYGLSALGAQIGVDMARSFPAPVTESGRKIAEMFGVEDDGTVPKGQDFVDFLPNMGPIPSVTTELFSKSQPAGQVTGLPKPVEGLLVPRPIRTVTQAETARKAGSVRDAQERFLKNFESGADLSSFWNAFWSSPTYRSLALGFPQAETSVRYQTVVESLRDSEKYKEKRVDYVKKISGMLIRGEFEDAVEAISEALSDSLEGPEGRIPLWGQRKDRIGGKDITPRQDLFESVQEQLERARLPMEHRAMKALPAAVRQAHAKRLSRGMEKAFPE